MIAARREPVRLATLVDQATATAAATLRQRLAGLLGQLRRLGPPPEAEPIMAGLSEALADGPGTIATLLALHDAFLYQLTRVWRDWGVELLDARERGQVA